MIGVRGTLKLAQFKPAWPRTPRSCQRYQANRLRVVRQVYFSTRKQDSIDLVLFLNGIPVATVELKTDFTQSVGDAIDQYRFDRNPKDPGQPAEPLLTFQRGALVHFAVSNAEVHMTTKLAGKSTLLPAVQPRRQRTAARATPRTPTATPPRTCGRTSGSATAGCSCSAATSSRRRTRRGR
jgi:hypothetical protein